MGPEPGIAFTPEQGVNHSADELCWRTVHGEIFEQLGKFVQLGKFREQLGVRRRPGDFRFGKRIMEFSQRCSS